MKLNEDAICRPLSPDDQAEYDRLTENAKQIEMEKEALVSKPVCYGYARVSSKGQARDGNGMEAQEEALKNAGAAVIYKDVYTGTTTDRPQLDRLVSILRSGDTLIVTKLDRVARSVQQGIALIDGLAERGIKINVLNMGLMDNSPTGRLIRNVMLSFAEFERDMIMARTREGKEIARQKPGYREGRRPKYSNAQLEHAMALIKDGYGFKQVTDMTGISKSTLIRAKRRSSETERQ